MRIGITLGDPAGVGGELVLLLIRELGPAAPVTVFGSMAQLGRAAAALGMTPPLPFRPLPADAVDKPEAYVEGPTLLDLVPLTQDDVLPAVPTRAGGQAQLRYLSLAAQAAKQGRIQAVVTAPVNKGGISQVMGSRFSGQTELLARLAGLRSSDVAMAFTGEKLRTVVVTTHIALKDVPATLKAERIEKAVRLEVDHLEELGFRKPRLVVAGLNPHAGEGGLFGDEEHLVISPAVGALQTRFTEEGMRATISGPLPVDTAFRRHLEGRFDAVVAMYHDQAMLACRLAAFGETVNVTLGLPFVRTSPDHGTAYDLAGKGLADPRGVLSAYRLAVRLVELRGRARET
ncbi:MAG: 4-hydroxythreonine-4-phosphate dehydrogenase PdxA [Deltaproteobacteria bacterium]|nr:4-hydroxythreonine-4-phosphate dehydrogenase PdxA [Deltaproteobacteria bacterium]